MKRYEGNKPRGGLNREPAGLLYQDQQHLTMIPGLFHVEKVVPYAE
jgi:hypothetical protein